MNEDDYRRELARKDSVISDLASQLANTNQQLAEMMQKDTAKGTETPTSATPAAAMTPTVHEQFRAIIRQAGIELPEELPPGALAFIRASAITQKR